MRVRPGRRAPPDRYVPRLLARRRNGANVGRPDRADRASPALPEGVHVHPSHSPGTRRAAHVSPPSSVPARPRVRRQPQRPRRPGPPRPRSRTTPRSQLHSQPPRRRLLRAATPAVADKRVPKLTIGVTLDTGPLNIYSSDSAFDWMVELVYDKLLAPRRTSTRRCRASPRAPPRSTIAPGSSSSATASSGTTASRSRPTTWCSPTPRSATARRAVGPTTSTTCPRSTRSWPKTLGPSSSSATTPARSLGTVTFADLPILPKHIWENIKEPQTYSELPIGTGPYKLVELRPDQLYRFQANEGYFLGRPLVDELVMPIIKDPSAMFTALKTGELDIAVRDVPPELRTELGRLPAMKLVNTTPLSLVELRLNYERAPFDKPEFRGAFSLMIDRQAIVDSDPARPRHARHTRVHARQLAVDGPEPVHAVRSGGFEEAARRASVRRSERRRHPRDAGRPGARVWPDGRRRTSRSGCASAS